MDPFLGQIMMFGGNFAPRGWAFCNGQLLAISANSALFSLLGTAYGGDGRTTFGLPDLRGRVPIHQGTGPGLRTARLGAKGGEESVTLNTLQIPSHSHSGTIEAADPVARGTGTDSPTNAYPAQGSTYATSKNVRMASDAVLTNPTGGSQAHDNMQPYQVVSYVIALQGIYPSRS